MIAHQFIIYASLLVLVTSHPLSYQKVQFVVGNPKPKDQLHRNSQSFAFPSFNDDDAWWSTTDFLFPPPSISLFDLSVERGHFSPDYSNGLEYPDPLLLRGKDALYAVKYLYGRGELFYHQIPHVRALLNNQEQRRINGLEGNHLSSNRPNSPFFRYN